MKFVDVQKTVRDLIAAHEAFGALAATTVFVDMGDQRAAIEAALADLAKGYAVSVWPPARGHSDAEQGGVNGVDALVVVRFEVNPAMLAALPAADDPVTGEPFTPPEWVNVRLAKIISAVLSAPQEAGGVKFTLAPDAFELVNFDEGLVAYHIRFMRFVVL